MKAELKTIALKDITPYEGNERVKTSTSVTTVAKSIKEFGYNVPIIVTKDYVIVAGHSRYLALKQLKKKNCACLVLGDMPETEIAKLRVLDNHVSDLGAWDLDKLGGEFRKSLVSDEAMFKDLALFFPDTAFADALLKKSVGNGVTEFTQEDIEEKRNSMGRKHTEAKNTNDAGLIEIICPNCEKTFFINLNKTYYKN